ncbi:hypothetical protein F3Y22_tig00111309pilonHSYRG00117 [Hibiscus syriacus]|uniref:DNA (Cytosine-5)-methyltransferase DRM1/2 n=1 Tax=Hibiscus syriacus TaxID=106335 RepID=A0A6A2YRP6_HIBSY|nr:hypothetical protein F3Y22_tig00111309pilonHSYRG00117 [Hibiscus syriacus]
MISQILIVLSDTEEILNYDSDEENKLLFLIKMGYSEAEASIAMERCGPDSSIAELTDFICADQMVKAADKQRKLEKKLLNEDYHAVHLSIPMIGSGVPIEPDQITQRILPEDAIGSSYFYYEQIHLSNPMIGFGVHTKPDQITQRTLPEDAIRAPYFYYEQIHLSNLMIGFGVYTKPDQITQRTLPEDAIGAPYFYYEQIHLSNPMIGFGVHTKPDQITQRTLPEDAIGASYFYYENMALAPVNIWTGISQYLFDVEPEFVDSKHFHAVTLKIGYIHNLPIENIFPLILKCQIDRNDLNKILPLESDEVEMLLEVTFYCLGILLKTYVQELNDDRLEQLMSSFVEFDLVVSGIQRNNLTGRNKHHQDELDDFCCKLLKGIMDIILTKKMIGMKEVAIMYQDLSQHHSITRVQESVTSSLIQTFWLLGPLAFKNVKCFIILASFILFLQQRDASRFQNLRNVFEMCDASLRA